MNEKKYKEYFQENFKYFLGKLATMIEGEIIYLERNIASAAALFETISKNAPETKNSFLLSIKSMIKKMIELKSLQNNYTSGDVE